MGRSGSDSPGDATTTGRWLRLIGRQEHVGVQDTVRIEAPLDRPERGDLGWSPGEVEPPSLGHPDAVLGADASAEVTDHTQHLLVHSIIVREKTTHVDMDVAVPDVTEQPGTCRRSNRRHRTWDLVDEPGQ